MSTPKPHPASAEILPSEQATEARRWSGPDFFVSTEPPLPATPTAPPGPTIAELEAIEAQAHAAGYQAGLEQGRQAAAAELEVQRQQLERLFAAMARPLDELDRQVEAELTELAVHIARQVVYRSIELQPQSIQDTVKAALAALPMASRQVRLRLHPEDAALLQGPDPVAAENGWKLVPDPSLSRGDVVVDAEMSHIDARVESRLSRLAETLRAGQAPVEHE